MSSKKKHSSKKKSAKKHSQNQQSSQKAVAKSVETSPEPQEKKSFWHSLRDKSIKALSAMAQGLFASLLVGTMISTFGEQFHIPMLVEVGNFAKGATGYAMAIAIGTALQASPLVLFSLVTVGGAANTFGGAGGPFAVLLVTVFTSWVGSLVSQKTKFDIIVTPMTTVTVGYLAAYFFAPMIGNAASFLGNSIIWATELQPFFMGIILSVVVGIMLTLPISSAAICAGLGLTGLAGGAALAGCSAQMVGFAVMSYKENGISGLFSQGLGTSMLQIGNIVKNPKIWIPPILTSAITGPISTVVFRGEMNGAAVASGMGTCGLVGQIGTYTGWVNDVSEGVKASITAMDWIGLLSTNFILPALLTPIFYQILVKMGHIKEGDLKLD